MLAQSLRNVVSGDIVTDRDGMSFVVREIVRNSDGIVTNIAGVSLAEPVDIRLAGLERESQSVTGKILESVSDVFGSNPEYVRRLWTSNVTQEQLRSIYYALNRIGVLLVICNHPKFEPYPSEPPHDSERCARCGLNAKDINAIAATAPPEKPEDANPIPF